MIQTLLTLVALAASPTVAPASGHPVLVAQAEPAPAATPAATPTAPAATPAAPAATPAAPAATPTAPTTAAAGTAPAAPAPAVVKMPEVGPRTDLEDRTFWMPPQGSTGAAEVDWLFYGVLALSIFCFVGITVATVYFAWRYRSRPGHKAEPSSSHNDAMEITWTVIPSIICVFIFIFGWRGFLSEATPPDHALEIQVTAQKWFWSFQYPNGTVDADLHVPAGEPVRLVMRSKDVLHSFFVPSFRIKQDVVPNRYTKLWFEAPTPGVFRLYCAEYCGADHSQMKHFVVVHPPGGYEQWLDAVEEAQANMPPVELGKKMYEGRGCMNCHSLDGSGKTGPTWKGLFGKQEQLSDGSTIEVDETYLRESMLDPLAKVVSGFQPVMPSFKGQLKDRQIDGLIAFIKSLK